jgi:hypothetical protein
MKLNVNIQLKDKVYIYWYCINCIKLISLLTALEVILGNCENKNEDASPQLFHGEFAGSSSNIEAKTESVNQNSPNSGSYLYIKIQ